MKSILFIISTLIIINLHAQVGIGTDDLAGNSILEFGDQNLTLVVPRVGGTAKINTPVNGILVFDALEGCIKLYQNNAWTTCDITGAGVTPTPDDTNPSTGTVIITDDVPVSPANHAILEIQSFSNKAMTLPITSFPELRYLTNVAGSMVFDPSADCVKVFDGSNWVCIGVGVPF